MYLQSIFENHGDDWKEKRIGETCKLYQGLAINAKTKHLLVEKSDLPLLRIKDLRDNTVEQYVDPLNYPRNSLVNKSDLIYTRTGQIGLVFTGRYGILHNNSFKIVPDASLIKGYLFWVLQDNSFKTKITKLALRAAQPDITHSIFKDQTIFIPPLSEQRAIVAKLDALSTETKKLEAIYNKKLANLDELKKSILQKAFNGEL
jgi:type I restriction enzyme S subunit